MYGAQATTGIKTGPTAISLADAGDKAGGVKLC
jgi:hypothetical protein